MMKPILFLLLFMAGNTAWPDAQTNGLQVDVERDGRVYAFSASFNTPLTKCAAYRFLTDYEVARKMPGVIELLANRQSDNKVKIDFTAEESILFFHVRLHSVMENTEKPFDGVSFTQLSGDLKMFQGDWKVEQDLQGSTLRVKGLLERDTRIPLFIVDYFVKNSLTKKFSAIAELAEKQKDMPFTDCAD